MAIYSIEFRRAIAALAVAEMIAAGASENDALAVVAETVAGGAFAGADNAARIRAIQEFCANLARTAAVAEPSRPLEISKYHYDQTLGRLRAIGRSAAGNAELLLTALRPDEGA